MQDYKQLANEMIEANKPLSKIQGALDKHFKQEHKKEFEATLRAEYDLLFPATEIVQVEELQEDGSVVMIDTEVAIDYSDNPDYVTFDEYKAETIVVSEAVLDIDGNVVEPEVTELVRPYVPPVQTDIDLLVTEDIDYKVYSGELAKVKKDNALEALQVEHNTVMYDANGKAIGNMNAVVSLAGFKYITLTDQFKASALADTTKTDTEKLVAIAKNEVAVRAEIYKNTTVSWKGADNVLHTVMVESICEALEASMSQVGTIYAESV